MQEEIWKDIKGYEGLYQISNHGRVKSLHFGKERIRKPSDSRGYPIILLNKGGKYTVTYIHRLVATYFVPNPDNKPEINHLDENKKNNRADNLAWCTEKENTNWGTRTERARKSMKGKLVNRKDVSKKVDRYTVDGEYLDTYPSLAEAARTFGLFYSNIAKVCRGENKTSGGYKWKFSESP